MDQGARIKVNMKMGLLDGKVAIITGSGRGIGKAMAEKFVSEGCKVAINDIDADVCAATAEEIKSKGGEAIACKADVTNMEEVQKMVDDTVAAFGTVHILVNNAGFCRDKMIFSMSEEEFVSVVRVHLKGHFCNMHLATAY